MKLSVEPESTSTCLSALACKLCSRVGILSDFYLLVKTLLTFSKRAQAVGDMSRF
jgi:hypothetical protein